MDVTDAVCIVTGASSGIGAATARLLSENGAHVVLAARRANRLDALAAELSGSLAVPTDVTAPGEVERLVAQTLDTFGRIDVLVNNAGQGLHVPLRISTPAICAPSSSSTWWRRSLRCRRCSHRCGPSPAVPSST